jgi:hypothetical protein
MSATNLKPNINNNFEKELKEFATWLKNTDENLDGFQQELERGPTLFLKTEEELEEDKKQEEERKKDVEFNIKEMLRKLEILKRILKDRPDLAKNPNFLNAINKSSSYVEKLQNVHEASQRVLIVHQYRQSMTDFSLTDALSIKIPAILPNKSSSVEISAKTPETKSLVKDLDLKTFITEKTQKPATSLDDTLGTLVKQLRELLQINTEHKILHENKINNPTQQQSKNSNTPEDQSHVPLSLQNTFERKPTKIDPENKLHASIIKH